MRRKFTVYGLRFSKTTFWNRINTGFLEPAVLQQYLPLAVLKLFGRLEYLLQKPNGCNSTYRLRYWNCKLDFSHLKEVEECCNSTYRLRYWNWRSLPTIQIMDGDSCNSTYRLRYWNPPKKYYYKLLISSLQQYLPLAVLKHGDTLAIDIANDPSCNSTYRLRYWNPLGQTYQLPSSKGASCKSTYRLRYWNFYEFKKSLWDNTHCCNSTYRLRYWNSLRA